MVSLGWHRVLDTIRLSRFKTLRTGSSRGWYDLLPEVKERLQQIKDLATQILVLSYAHATVFRIRALELLPWESDYWDFAVTTEGRIGRGGKIWALDQFIAPDTKVWHADDNIQICREIFEGRHRHQVDIRAAGIKVPSHWRQQREVTGVFWYQNVLDALDAFAEALADSD